MVGHDIFSRYVGTFGGGLWAVFHPLSTVLTYWFVFSVGFKVNGPSGTPFIVYFITGFAPWLLFNSTILSNVSVISANAHLVKKTVFPIEVLPIVKLIAETATHFLLLLILLCVLGYYGYFPTLFTLQVLYYFFAECILVLGLSWLLSALQVFHRDINQGIGVILNLWFWLTPIVWSDDMIPQDYRWLIQVNPFIYIVDGYRNAFLIHRGAWLDIGAGATYWLTAGIILLSGAQCFRKLKPHFADVV
jgi:lipopolysaccharide transport system permease protein/teichoic acid transport system permease protein